MNAIRTDTLRSLHDSVQIALLYGPDWHPSRSSPGEKPLAPEDRDDFFRDMKRVNAGQRPYIPGWRATVSLSSRNVYHLPEAPAMLFEFLQAQLEHPRLRALQQASLGALRGMAHKSSIHDFLSIISLFLVPLVTTTAEAAAYRVGFSSRYRLEAADALLDCNPRDLKKLDAKSFLDVLRREPAPHIQRQLAKVLPFLKRSDLEAEAPTLEDWLRASPLKNQPQLWARVEVLGKVDGQRLLQWGSENPGLDRDSLRSVLSSTPSAALTDERCVPLLLAGQQEARAKRDWDGARCFAGLLGRCNAKAALAEIVAGNPSSETILEQLWRRPPAQTTPEDGQTLLSIIQNGVIPDPALLANAVGALSVMAPELLPQLLSESPDLDPVVPAAAHTVLARLERQLQR